MFYSLFQVTMARSRSIHGPYEPYANNPVYTNANTTNYRASSIKFGISTRSLVF